MFLLDTEVVVELRNARLSEGNTPLLAWAASVPRHTLFLSAMSLIELRHAAARASRRSKDAGAAWDSWIADKLLPAFDGRILPLDTAVALKITPLAPVTLRDAMLVATATEHKLTIATRRTAEFKALKLKTVDPWRHNPQSSDDGNWREASRTGSLWLKNLFVRA
jgi:toxin FitB